MPAMLTQERRKPRNAQAHEDREGAWQAPVDGQRVDVLVDPSRTPRLRYRRVSSDDPKKQTFSLPAQTIQLDQQFGAAPDFDFWERMSGTTFEDRQAINALYRTCQANRRSRDNPGFIECVNLDRFSRQWRTTDAGKKVPDTATIINWFTAFELLGWKWFFLDTPPTGMNVGDLIMVVVKGEQNADESAKKSGIVSARKELLACHVDEGGFWLGGNPPFGTCRKDYTTGQVVPWGFRTQPSHRVILDRCPDHHQTLLDILALLRSGMSPNRVAAQLEADDRPLRGDMVSWNSRTLYRIVQNEALIGYPVFRKGREREQPYKAKWGPLVDEALFREANAQIAGRSRGAYERSTKPRVLVVHCKVCEVVLTRKRSRHGAWEYRHPHPASIGGTEMRRKAMEGGCTGFALNADAAERVVFQQIGASRLSADYVEQMNKVYRRMTGNVTSAAEKVSQKLAEYQAAQAQYQTLQNNLSFVTSAAVMRDLDKKLTTAEQDVARKRRAWMDAQQNVGVTDGAWERFQRDCREADDLAKLFDHADAETRTRARQALFEHWVEQVDVALVARACRTVGYAGTTRFKTRQRTVMGKRLAIFLAPWPERYRMVDVPDYEARKVAFTRQLSSPLSTKSYLHTPIQVVVPNAYTRAA